MPWRRLEDIGWYGCGGRAVEAASGTAVWHHTGLPAVLVRWVLVRDPAGGFSPQALLCTDFGTDPAEVLAWFVRRWSVEVTFAGGAAGRIHRRHLSSEIQRQWTDKAVARTTPAVLGLLSPVALWARELQAQGRLPHRRGLWLRKEEPTLYEAHRVTRNLLGLAGGMLDEIGTGLAAPVRRFAAPPCIRSARGGCLTNVPRSWANARPGGRDPSLRRRSGPGGCRSTPIPLRRGQRCSRRRGEPVQAFSAAPSGTAPVVT
ncbi:MAG: hypothetical protein AVDCRST_MAG08-2941 [uncultured Acetobacteraceae bacterium]|uniref:Uncharacterized protein n=1 Tax=uncultured Acetobacteraceae bacterium TaxID=169975 RepID=A0A6J4J4A1_9PROT|nr:MAG: hypothetical protein AVDCRST_MAG08-2941 [uncultured Acetobacteraceae bacterium]